MGVLKIIRKPPSRKAPMPRKIWTAVLRSLLKWPQFTGVSSYLAPLRGIGLVAIACGFVGFSLYFSMGGRWAKNIRQVAKFPVLFEIKALDLGGHPVAGANVYLGAKKIGVTDSFGEWRRFIGASRGQSLRLIIKKEGELENLQVEKNLLIPLHRPKEGELTVKMTLHLARQGEAPLEKNNFKDAFAASLEQTTTLQGDRERKTEAGPHRYGQSIWFTVMADAPASSSQTSFLRERLLMALKREAERQGLSLEPTSSWQVGLTHLAAQGHAFAGLLRVVARHEESKEPRDFLINYNESSQQMAQNILQMLYRHTPKPFTVTKADGYWLMQAPATAFWRLSPGQYLRSAEGGVWQLRREAQSHKGYYLVEPLSLSNCAKQGQEQCVVFKSHLPHDPPALDWQRKKIYIYGLESDEADVYWGGYKAQYEGKQSWSFWGKEGMLSFLSVVQNGKVVFRQQLDPAKQNYLVTSIPGSPLVHR